MPTETLSAVNIPALIASLEGSQTYFNRSTSTLTEADSGFKPTEACMTTAGQVSHIAQTIDWFIDATLNEEGFNMDFESLDEEAQKITSLDEARARLDESYRRALNLLRTKSEDFWASSLPEGPVMGGLPKATVIPGIVEHTAHHRGALTVYARLLNKVPPMPYM